MAAKNEFGMGFAIILYGNGKPVRPAEGRIKDEKSH